jgi:FAD/FMN-containing dehydrogenase
MSTFSIDSPTIDDLRRSHDGDVYTSADADWDAARQPWHVLVDQRPAAVAYPETPADVAAAIRYARAAGLRVAMQSTGHNATAFGGLGEDTLLVRTDRMRAVEIDPVRRRARAGAGALWEHVVVPAAPHGLAALHGSSPDVGVGGYSLGGGVGWLFRSRGLATNSLTALEVVTADGEELRVDAHHEPDLFWALRGGGGNYAAVTALEFALYPMPQVYAGWLMWPWQESERVLRRWAEWTETVPETLTSVAQIFQFPDIPMLPQPLRGRDLVVVKVAFEGDQAAGERLMAPLRELRPEMDTLAMGGPETMMRLAGDPEGPTPAVVDTALFDRMDGDAIDAFLSTAGPDSPSVLVSNEIRHMGGAGGRPAETAGALTHIDASFMLISVGMPMDPDSIELQHKQVLDVGRAMLPFGRDRHYLNLAERKVDPARFYGAEAYDRLRAIRREVDPDGLFRSNHEIPMAE